VTGHSLRIKRVYEAPASTDGYRVLVDRLWPRGLTRERAELDLWLKDVAPSAELRTWFGHDPARFLAFSERYRTELADNPAVAELREAIQSHPTTTLLFAAHDPEVNHAVVLRDFLDGQGP